MDRPSSLLGLLLDPKSNVIFFFWTFIFYFELEWVTKFLINVNDSWCNLSTLRTETCFHLMILCRQGTLSRTPWWGDWSGVTRCLWAGLCSLDPAPLVTSPPAQLTCFTALHSGAPHVSPVCVLPQVLSFPLGPECRSCWPAQAPLTPCCSLAPPGH